MTLIAERDRTWRGRTSLRAILEGRFEEAEQLVSVAHDQMAAFDPRGAFEAYSGQLTLLRWEQG